MGYELGLIFVTYNKTLQTLFVITRPEEQEWIIKIISVYNYFSKSNIVDTLYLLNPKF